MMCLTLSIDIGTSVSYHAMGRAYRDFSPLPYPILQFNRTVALILSTQRQIDVPLRVSGASAPS